MMPDTVDLLQDVGELVAELRNLGLEPILVGGMALVVLGSHRATRNVEFVIPRPGDRLDHAIGVLYDRRLKLVSHLNEVEAVTSTISSRRVASTRLRLDTPAIAYFFNAKTGLRVDLLFDFPIPAAELAENATRMKIRSYVFQIASVLDLLRLKQIAKANRSAPGDTQDIAFLEARIKAAQESRSN
jgi:hypothetical protein